jgi:lauroyl/myristoyl acyltransferase
VSKFDIPFEYLDWVVSTKKNVDSLDVESIGGLEILHHFMSACYSKMYPELPNSEHFNFSKTVKFHQMWAAFDQEFPSLINDTIISDSDNVLGKAKEGNPFIICTYHLGSYRLLNSILISKDIDFCLVTDNQYIKDQGKKTKEIFKSIRNFYSLFENKDLEILDAENPLIGLQTIRKLKMGYTLLFYIDGNTGVTSKLSNLDNFVKINFLNTQYYARKGIAYLSYISGVPIIPVVSLRTNWLERKVIFHSEIKVDLNVDKENYCNKTTQKLYDILSDYLKKYPEQWESWMYVHKSIKLNEEKISAQEEKNLLNPDENLLVFNFEEYELMNFGSQFILFEKNNLKIHIISEQFYNVLTSFREPISFSKLNFENFKVTKKAILELIELKILH